VGEFNWVDLSQIPVLIESGREAAQRVLPRILGDLNMEAEVES
jgi:hypothetical protein